MKPHPFTCAATVVVFYLYAAQALAVPATQEPLVVPDHDQLSPPPTEVDLSVGWVDPRILGGRMLDWPGGELGEPLKALDFAPTSISSP